MSTVLRASGPDFDVDAFVADCDWNFARVYHRGEPRRSLSGEKQRTWERSGFNATVSDAGFEDFDRQVEDSIRFLTSAQAKIAALVELLGGKNVVLDFGVASSHAAMQSHTFPLSLVGLAGRCGIALQISRYPLADDSPAAQ